jgi:hypothetical protein
LAFSATDFNLIYRFDPLPKRIEARLVTLGEDLFKAVFTTAKAQALFQQFQHQHADRLLTIHTNEAQILALPWELLGDPKSTFLCRQQLPISIRRYCVQSRSPSYNVQAKAKLRLLFIVSRPSSDSDEGFLNPRLDPQAVMDALAANDISQIEVEFLRPATLRKLEQRLEKKALPPVDIIHFDGHGNYDEKKQLGYLLFETLQGTKNNISAEQLSNILTPHHIALVVLSACQSATIGNEPFGSVAAGLTDKGVPTVLAMTYSVLVQTTRQLFAAFYQALATGQGIGAALDSARQTLAQHNQRGKRRRGEGEFELTLQDWFVPVLYSTGQNDVLLQSNAPKLAKAELCHDLPTLQAAGFFGRSRELWQIERWFVQGVERITITGFGGQGKTYCAIEAAHWLLRTDLFDSVCFVDFSRYQGLDALRYAMNELGVLLDTTIQFEENDKDKLKLELQEKLGTQRLLWVWDNLESLATETLKELLRTAAELSKPKQRQFLFTTRQHRFTQADYAESNPKHQYLDLAGLAEDAALEYFNQCWRLEPIAKQPYPERYELISLFTKVAFHPLLINLLAQELKEHTIAELGERLEVLLEDCRDNPMIASLKSSLEQLTPEQWESIKLLGVFQNGAMEDVLLEITEINQDEWLELRNILQENSLIEIEVLGDAKTQTGNPVAYIKFHPMLALTLWEEMTKIQQENILTRYCQSYYGFSYYLWCEDIKNPVFIRQIAILELPNIRHAVSEALKTKQDYCIVTA